MTVKTGQAWAGTFVTLDSTGALAAGSPAGALYVDGVANAAAVTITGTNPYKWAVTLPTLTAGQRVDMYITATIATIATAGIVASDQADTALVSEVKSETAAILADTGTDIPATLAGLATSAALATVDTNVDSVLADTNEIQAELADGGRTDLLIDAIKAKTDTIAAAPTAASVADAVWDEAIADHTSVGSFGAKNQKVVPSETVGDYKADVSALATAAALDAVDNFIDTEITTIDGIVDAIKLKTDLIPASPAEAGEYTAAIAAIPTAPLLAANYTAPDNTSIAAIKAKTDNLPASPAPANEYDTELTAIQADLDNPTQYKADVSGLATQTSVNAIPTSPLLAANYVAPDNAGIGAIKTKTDQLVFTTPNKVDASATIDPTGLATSADLAVVDENVDAIKEKTDQFVFTEAGSVDATATVDTSGIVSDVWSYKIRTLTNRGSSATSPAEGDPLEIYRDTTVYITLTGIGATTGYTKIWFTVKEDLEDADTDAILQIDTTDKLKYIDGKAGTSTDGLLVIDSEEETADITLLQASAQLLPVYTAYPAFWDLKMLNDGVVSLLSTGEIYIYSTPTRSIS